MGGTGRRRKRKLHKNLDMEPIRLNNNIEVINLLRSLVPSLTKAKICPALFPYFERPKITKPNSTELNNNSDDDGTKNLFERKINYYRGMCSNEKIKAGTEILRIPQEVLITVTKLPGEIAKLEDVNGHSKLALYLLLESSKKESSDIKPYLDTLPKDFKHHPAYLSSSTQLFLPSLYQNLLSKQHDNISRTLFKLRKNYENDDQVLKLLTIESFRYFWYCVYTRSVYYSEDHAECDSQQGNNLALAPYLDLFNHSPVPNTRVSFEMTKSTCGKIQRFYVIRAIQSIGKFDEIFISYGNHPNFTLWADYGFVPRTLNPNNYIPLKFQVLLQRHKFFQSLWVDKRKADIVQKFNLTDELNLMENDVSYNLTQLISIYLWNPSTSSSVEYVDPSCPEYRQLLTLIIQDEVGSLKETANVLQKVMEEDTVYCDMQSALDETLLLLETSVKFLGKLLTEYQ